MTESCRSGKISSGRFEGNSFFSILLYHIVCIILLYCTWYTLASREKVCLGFLFFLAHSTSDFSSVCVSSVRRVCEVLYGVLL